MEHFHTLVVHCKKTPNTQWVKSVFGNEWFDEKEARTRAINWTEGHTARVAVVMHRNGAIVAVYTSK